MKAPNRWTLSWADVGLEESGRPGRRQEGEQTAPMNPRRGISPRRRNRAGRRSKAQKISSTKRLSADPEKRLGQFDVSHIALNLSAIMPPSGVLVAAIPPCTADSIVLYIVFYSS